MKTNLIIFLTVIVGFSLFAIFINWIANLTLRKKLSQNEHPDTLVVYKSTLFVSGAILTHEITFATQSLIKILAESFSGSELIFKEVAYFCLFLSSTMILLIVILFYSALISGILLKKKNIFFEIASNKMTSQIIYSSVILSLTIAIKPVVTLLLDSFIPYPTFPVYN